jgi:hypothetical protein
MRKAQNALAGREAMRHSTKVIKLDGSRALRSKTANFVSDFLSICATEQMSNKEIQAAFETYQGKVQAERDAEQEQKASQTAREEEEEIEQEEYSWYTSQVRQRKCIIKEGVGDTTNQMRPKEQTEIKQMENKLNTPQQQAPIFASFAGMDLLGMGLRKTFKAGKCVGGSEWNNSARKLFHREHGFDPFEDHEHVPDYAYKYMFMVTTGAPCVAFSRAGSQKGQADKRGIYYVAQADDYIRAKVPVILFEHVREARDVLKGDLVSRGLGKLPQDQLVQKLEEAGYIVPKGPDGEAGIVINATDQGSVLDRSRLFTLAVIKELYDKSTKKKEFE